jgi:hypothetical protein
MFAIVQTDASTLVNKCLNPVEICVSPGKFAPLCVRQASILLKLPGL